MSKKPKKECLPPFYSGEHSRAFWNAVRRHRGLTHADLYTLGVGIQAMEAMIARILKPRARR